MVVKKYVIYKTTKTKKSSWSNVGMNTRLKDTNPFLLQTSNPCYKLICLPAYCKSNERFKLEKKNIMKPSFKIETRQFLQKCHSFQTITILFKKNKNKIKLCLIMTNQGSTLLMLNDILKTAWIYQPIKEQFKTTQPINIPISHG